MKRVPSRFAPAFAVAAVFLLISLLTRACLASRPEVASLPLADLAQAFARGLLFDSAAAVYWTLPLALWLALVPNVVARWRLHRALMVVAVWGACFAAAVLAVAEWLFWDEFGGRFNFIAVDYLLYTHEVLSNIWQSYPVGRILIGLGAAAALVAALCARAVWRSSAQPLGWRGTLAATALCVLALGGVLRLVDSDQKQFSAADAANDLAGNGLYEFFAANRRNALSFDRYYATLPLPLALDTVRAAFPGARWVAPEQGGIERLEPGQGKEKRLNVVLVSIESLGAEFLGAYGDGRGLTPHLDRLAGESLWFTNVYATGNRTVRGLEALALALPPTPGQSIVRRPDNDKLFSLGSVFEDKGYDVLFAYGGYGYFDNMNAFFDANDYRVVDRRDIPAGRIEFENVWGVADEHLFDQVLDEIDRGKAAQPDRSVFVHVMTTSNHRPFTYPPGRIDIPPASGRDGGVKYTDYAVGRFLERARGRPWFGDTVFVITADHGADARGTLRIPVDKYRIPLFVYSPRHVPPRRFDRLMSQIDIAPTLLGLLDFNHYTKFLGRDVLRSPPETDRAFVANYQTLGYMKGDALVVLQPKRKLDVYRLLEGGRALKAFTGADRDALSREAIAFYQVASHAFHNGLYRDEEQLPLAQRR